MNLPNKLTVGRIIAVPFFIAAYLTQMYLVAFVLFIAASLTDMLDGKIARKYNLVTNFGKIMDPLADKILVYSAFCLMVPDLVPSWMLIVILAREFTIAGIRQVSAAEGIVIAAAMSGKIKTVLQMIAVPALLLAQAIQDPYPVAYPIIALIAEVFLYASIAMTIYSGIEYIVKNKNVFKN